MSVVYTQEDLERIVKERVADYAQHQVVEQLKSRLDASNNIREDVLARLNQMGLRLDKMEYRGVFWSTMRGKAVTSVATVLGIVVALHDLGIIK